MSKDEIKNRLRAAMRKSPSRGKIKRISLFGSYLHGDSNADSDIDLLIEISDDNMGFFEFAGIQYDLEQHLNAQVDLVEPEALSKYIRDDVLSEAQPVYETA